MKVLVTGIAGKLGQLVATRLSESGYEVFGVDTQPWDSAPRGVEVFVSDIRKRPAEDVVRTKRPHAVIHMATVAHLFRRHADRFRINLNGTRAMMEHCHHYGVQQFIFAGRHTYYGAAADSTLYHSEDEPPFSSQNFPELADLVAADLYASSALWRHPEITTSILRVCYTLGPAAHGTLAGYLSRAQVPMLLGFDPLFQFIHETDAARAIVAALESKLHGVYNVAGPSPLPLSRIVRETGRRPVRIPEPLLNLAAGRFGLPKLPPGALQHLKYPIVVDSSAFRAATDFHHFYDEQQTLTAFAEHFPVD
ncbi:MAG: NAD-dependent epimerase/dehydratase family protein [Polyangiales bacterium]